MSRSGSDLPVILLIEDNPADVELTRIALSKGRRLEVVRDGQEALDYLHRRGEFEDPERSPWPDLVLLDLNLPRLDGREFLREISEDPRSPSLNIIVLTSSAEEEDLMRSYARGVKSYVTKPAEIDEFLRTILTLEEYWLQTVDLPGEPSLN
ncbi:MAG: response regulator [Planctomycetota bacterium]